LSALAKFLNNRSWRCSDTCISRADSFFEDQDHTIFNGQAQTDNHNTQVPVGVPVPAALWGGLGLLGSLFTAKVIRRK